jgi:hypothetical protein
MNVPPKKKRLTVDGMLTNSVPKVFPVPGTDFSRDNLGNDLSEEDLKNL